jgi:Variant SH3 domain
MRVEHSFEAESDSEMSILVGELISVIEEVDSGWFIGEVVGDEVRTGMFPSTYCSIISSTSSTTKVKESKDVFGDVEEQVSNLSLRRPVRPSTTRTISSSSATGVGKKKPPPPPVSRGSKPSSSGSGDMKCRECGCDEFRANVFKKGSCNNCFHVHVPS